MTEDGVRPNLLRRVAKLFVGLLVTAALFTGAAFGVAQIWNHFKVNPDANLVDIWGLKALSTSELESAVADNKLVAYWVGPVDGFKYFLDASIQGRISVKYVPTLPSGIDGRTTRASYREIVTFEQKDAFETIQKQSGVGTCTNFINADGNSVHIDSAAPTIIYIGIKGKPIQVLLFDPDTTRNLSFACQKNGIVQIGKP